jgi:hypothetical protein
LQAPRQGAVLQRKAEARREERHRHRCAESEDRQGGDPNGPRLDRCEQHQAHACAPPETVREPDGERADGRRRSVLVQVGLLVGMGVHVHVVEAALVFVLVQMEAPGPPAVEQTQREQDDQDSDRHLGALLDRSGKPGFERDERHSDSEKGERVTEAPGEAEPARAAADAPGPSLACRERDHRSDVIRVRGVPEPEKTRRGEGDEEGGAVVEQP